MTSNGLLWNNKFAVGLVAGIGVFTMLGILYGSFVAQFLAEMLLGMVFMLIILRVAGDKNDK